MIRNKWVLGFIFADFFALTGYAIYAEGLSAMFSFIGESVWGWVLTADLLIALFLVVTYMFNDAKSRGDNPPVGWAALTFMTGSIGPLIYLMRK